MIVDTHAHIYSPDEKKYPPIAKPNRPPGGKGSLEDLRNESRANGVTHACAIQVTTFYRFDNRYILDSAAANRQWIAGVCTLDPDDPKSPAMLKDHVLRHSIRGMRSIPAKSGALDDPGVRALWKACQDAGIVVNVLVGREKTDQVSRLLAERSVRS